MTDAEHTRSVFEQFEPADDAARQAKPGGAADGDDHEIDADDGPTVLEFFDELISDMESAHARAMAHLAKMQTRGGWLQENDKLELLTNTRLN